MEGLGVVDDGVPQCFQVETTVASKGLAGFVFTAFSVHEYHDDKRDVAKHLLRAGM